MYQKNEERNLYFLKSLQNTIIKLGDENFEESIQFTMNLFDYNFPHTFVFVICHMTYTSFLSRKKEPKIYLRYLKTIEEKINFENKGEIKIFDVFYNCISKYNSQESYYLIETMLEENLICPNSYIQTAYFAHRLSEEELQNLSYKNQNYRLYEFFVENYVNLQKIIGNFKKFAHEGVNPLDIIKAIRNDDIEKLQEISLQDKFDFNQTIQPSIFERCSFINDGHHINIADYAAFFGSIKCFKFIQMNEKNLSAYGKFAVAGGNLEIFHLCEQNNSSFDGSYEAAIEFHQNDIFKYIYENNIIQLSNINNLISECINYDNYEILSFLEEKIGENVDFIINKSAFVGNIYLVKHFQEVYELPKDILVYSLKSQNLELINYILEQENIDFNAKDKISFSFLFYFVS